MKSFETEEDPVFIIGWNWPGLLKFAADANANANNLPPPPPEITLTNGLVSPNSIMNDFSMFCLNNGRGVQKYPGSCLTFGPLSGCESELFTNNLNGLISQPWIQGILTMDPTLKIGFISRVDEKKPLTPLDYVLTTQYLCPF